MMHVRVMRASDVFGNAQWMVSCAHRAHIKLDRLPDSVTGCDDCLAEGTLWFHLRICLECGQVGCCDASRERHAARHAIASGHPVMRSLQPDEDWSWCFIDGVVMVIREVQGSTRIPPSPLGG